jgi:hypothetical protein
MTTRVEVIETELRSIWEDRGRLVAAEVVELAADPGHALHDLFEWDDSEAAARWRVHQAQGMIRSVKISIVTADTPTRAGDDYTIRAWVANRTATGVSSPGYVPEEVVRGDPAQRERVLRQMLRELHAFRRRYQHLAEFWAAVAELGDEEAG